MKKTIITALIALLVVLAFVTCDGIITEPGAEKPAYSYTKDGRKLVTLSIKTGGTTASSRGINDTIAKAGANYVEVIFTDGTHFYKTEGYLGFPLTVTVPVDTYDETNSIMLIGREDDKTLLATAVPSASVDLTTDAPTIEFTVTPLLVNLSTSGDSFVIDDAGGFSDGTDPIVPDFTGKSKTGTVWNNLPLSCFLVPTGAADIEATLTIKINGDIYEHISDLIMVDIGASSVDFVKIINVSGNTDITPSAVVADIGYDDTTISDKFGYVSLDITFDTATSDSFLITFEIPVFGLSDTAVSNSDTSSLYTTGISWIIRGGTNSSSPELVGSIPDGEGVALHVADTSKMPITIPTPTWP